MLLPFGICRFGLVLLEYSVLDTHTATGEYFLLESERRYLFELYYLVEKKYHLIILFYFSRIRAVDR